MKTIITILLFITCSTAIAQNDFKPLDSLSSWQGRSVVNAGGGQMGFIGWQHFFTDSVYNDTIVGAKSYTKLFFESSPNTEAYFCGFRSDTIEKAIYILPKDSINEYLFFDFDSIMNIGDLILINSYCGNGFGNAEYYLQSIDSVLINSNYYKNWDFGEIIITERIVSSKNLPFHCLYEPYIGFSALELKCYYENNQSVYGTICPYTYEFSNMSNSITENEAEFEIYPNPFTDFIQINNAEESKLLIYNCLGELILSETINSETCSIDVGQFVSGVYLFKIDGVSKRVIKL